MYKFELIIAYHGFISIAQTMYDHYKAQQDSL